MMTFSKKPQEKTDYEQIKKEVSEAVKHEQESLTQDALQEVDCRRRYTDAQQEQNAALEAGNMEQYRKAGLAAESARLELEFCEKRKQKNKKPAATQDDDRKVQRALRTEEMRIKADTIDRIKELFAEIVTVCTDARNKFNEIDSVFDCWMSIVMKDNSTDKSITQGSKISIGSIENKARGTIAQLNLMKSE